MNDPPGVPPPLGIEVVEWIAEGGENLTVRVTGRWLRRRPAWSGQPTLVIEAPGRRYRFPAMPEPPSLTGAAPGTWRISFAVPASLAPDLGGRAWLQFGAVVVPLPAAVEPLGTVIGDPPESAPEGEVPEPDAPAPTPERPQPSSELEAEAARRRVADAEAQVEALESRVDELEGELGAARAEAARLSSELSAQAQSRRVAEQRAHAEQAQRQDLARELAERKRDADRARQALGDLAAAEERIRGLEHELKLARRRIDEAEQSAAAAAAARERAEREATEARAHAAHRAPATAAGLERLRLERDLVARRQSAQRRVPDEPTAAAIAPRSAADGPAAAIEAAQARLEALVSALRAELDLRASTEGLLHARLIDAEGRLAARDKLGERTGETLIALREELDGLRQAITRERAARREAERQAGLLERELAGQRERTTQALHAIVELRDELEALRAAAVQGARESESRADQAHARATQAEARATQAEALAAQAESRAAEAEARAEAAEQASVAPEPPAPEPPAPEESGQEDQLSPQPEPEPEVEGESVEPERLSQALDRLRDEIAPLEPPAAGPAAAEPPSAGPAAAEPPSAGPAAAEPPPAAPTRPHPTPPGAMHPPSDERLAEGGVAHRAWLLPVFRSLARSDPDRAGRLLVDLLPAQRAVHPEPLSYDLILGGDRGCARVTVSESGSRVLFEDSPRALRDVDFQIHGDYAALARLLIAGPIRRRVDRNVARVRGNRKGVAALQALVAARLDLVALYREGVRMHPRTALEMTAELIDPAWTTGVRFSIAYGSRWAETVYLVVNDGARVQVTEEPPDAWVSTAISGPAGAYELLLSGARPQQATLTGDEWPLALVSRWIKRAQSD